MRKEIKKALILLLSASLGMCSTVTAMGADCSQTAKVEAESVIAPDSISDEIVVDGMSLEETSDEIFPEETVTKETGEIAPETAVTKETIECVSEESTTENTDKNFADETTTEESGQSAVADADTEDVGEKTEGESVTEEFSVTDNDINTEKAGDSDSILTDSDREVIEDGQEASILEELDTDSEKTERTETSYVDNLGNTVSIISEELTDESLVGSTQSTVTSRTALVKAIRENLVNRKKTFSIPYKMSGVNISYLQGAYDEAVSRHTGNPREGDYLHFNTDEVDIRHKFRGNSGLLTVCTNYKTTAGQESIVTSRVNQALSGLRLSGKSEYEKIVAIHDYICKNVSYDYANLSNPNYHLKFTAYAALCNKKAVCQGYATLFYRMALQSGLDCRVIAGNANQGSHAWNIVRIGNRYYNIDVTWDDGLSSKAYFLKTDDSFSDHVRNTYYAGASFYRSYPMATTNYSTATKIPLSGASVCTRRASYTYAGNAKQPLPIVRLGGKTLVKDRDYRVSYSNNKNVGKATVTVTGTGSYKGTAKGTFNIIRCSIAKASVKTKSSSYVYTGNVRRPQPVVKLGNRILKLGTDYKLSYKNNKNIGTATVTVTGIGSYTGTAKTTFKLTKCSIAGASVATKSAKYAVTGKARCPKPVVKLGKRTLVYGKDYTLSYRNNVKAGIATVIVTGKGNYTGTAKAKFKLIK